MNLIFLNQILKIGAVLWLVLPLVICTSKWPTMKHKPHVYMLGFVIETQLLSVPSALLFKDESVTNMPNLTLFMLIETLIFLKNVVFWGALGYYLYHPTVIAKRVLTL